MDFLIVSSERRLNIRIGEENNDKGRIKCEVKKILV